MIDLRELVVTPALAVFRKQERLGAAAMEQLTIDQLFTCIDQESNSVAILVRHVHGNMLSRWTDFLTTDGEKPERHRDQEFVAPDQRTSEHVMGLWASGYACVYSALSALTSEDVLKRVTIRGEQMTVPAAIARQLDHYGQHLGQIILLARHLSGPSWRTLSIPRGKSEEFNRNFRATTTE